jgi:hypothetical protein
MVAKFPVLPVSATVAGVGKVDDGIEGGPSGASKLVQDGSVVMGVFNLFVLLLLGSPRPQVLVGALEALLEPCW